MIPEDVCTYICMYIKEISEYFIDTKRCMYIKIRKSVNTDCIDTMQEINVYTMSLHCRIHAPKFFIVLYQILSWEGAAGGAATLLGQLYHSEVMESIEV